MTFPIEIVLRHMDPSPVLEDRIREKATRLGRFFDRVEHCKVVVEAPHKHQHQGRLFHVAIQLGVPGDDIVVNRSNDSDHGHEDVYVALSDAFNAAGRQLRARVRRKRAEERSPR